MFWPNFFWVRPSKEKKSDYNPRLGPITLVQKKKKKKKVPLLPSFQKKNSVRVTSGNPGEVLRENDSKFRAGMCRQGTGEQAGLHHFLPTKRPQAKQHYQNQEFLPQQQALT